MRPTRQAFSLVLLVVAITTQAQLDTTWLTLGSFIKNNKNGSFYLRSSSSISSNAINAKMIGDYLTKPTFSEEGLNSYNSTNTPNTRVFYGSGVSISYILNENWEVRTGFDDVLYYTSSTELSRLLLNGNKNYLNEHLESANVDVQRFRRFEFSAYNRLKVKNHVLRFNYGVVSMPIYARLQAEEVHLFTSPDSVVANMQTNSFRQIETPGLGLQLGFSFYGSLGNNHQYAIDISNVNLFYVNKSNLYTWANNIKFSGFSFEPGKPFSEAVENERDNTLGLSEESQHLVVILPDVSLSYLIPLRSSSISLRAKSFYSVYAISTCWHKEIGNNLLMNLGIDGGNFMSVQTRTGIEFKAVQTALLLNVVGLNGLVTPKMPGGIGAEFGFSREF